MSTSTTERLEATAHGVVQGVGFRWHVRRSAARLGVVGWVANMADGSVAVVAEGRPDHLDALERELRAGPPGAVIERFEARRLSASGSFSRFEIRSRAHAGD